MSFRRRICTCSQSLPFLKIDNFSYFCFARLSYHSFSLASLRNFEHGRKCLDRDSRAASPSSLLSITLYTSTIIRPRRSSERKQAQSQLDRGRSREISSAFTQLFDSISRRKMGSSPMCAAVPLLYTASSTMLTLVWKVFISSISSSTSSSSHKATQVSPCPHRERPTYPPPLPRSTPELDLRLSTRCDSCGSKVSLQVPQWISDSIEIAQTTPYRQRCDGRCQNVGGSRNRTEGLRKSVVEGTVRFAQRVRSSPVSDDLSSAMSRRTLRLKAFCRLQLLPLLFAAMKAFVAFLIYLDARFLLRQQAVRVAEEVATGLVEIEKELGVMTNAGEGFSIGW